MSGPEIDPSGRRTLRRRRRMALLLADAAAPPPAQGPDAAGRAVAEDDLRVTLEDLLALAPLPPDAALHALRDVAEELRALAAERGVAHGDVKPWNVLVLPDGHAKVTDPGTVDGGDPVVGATRTGDAYWFAVLACEVLTGLRPIDREDAALLMERTRMPAAARDAVLRGLAAHPQRRPFPHTLVKALAKVPEEDWSAGRGTPAVADRAVAGPVAPRPVAVKPVEPGPVEPVVPAESPPEEPVAVAGPTTPVAEPGPRPAVAVTATVPEAAVAVPPPALPRRSLVRRLGPYVAAIGIALVLAGAGSGAWLLRLDAAQADDRQGSVSAERATLRITPPYTTCPLARVHLTATIVTDGSAGELTVSWRLPGGTRLPEKRVSVAEGQGTVIATLDVSVTGERRLHGPAVAVVRPGGARASTPFVFACAGGGRGGPGGQNR